MGYGGGRGRGDDVIVGVVGREFSPSKQQYRSSLRSTSGLTPRNEFAWRNGELKSGGSNETQGNDSGVDADEEERVLGGLFGGAKYVCLLGIGGGGIKGRATAVNDDKEEYDEDGEDDDIDEEDDEEDEEDDE